MIVIVLAGGLGTRLRPVVPQGPKCMGPVAGRPFLEHLVDALRGQGLRQFVFAIGYGGASIRAHFGTGAPFGVEASYSDDGDRLRGTGGALAHAVRTVSGPPAELILVANGDTWVDVDLHALEDAHARRRALVTILAVRTTTASGGAVLELASDDAVRRYGDAPGGSGLLSAGVYLAARQVLEHILPAAGVSPVSLERDVLPQFAGRGLYAVVTSGPFVDIGTPAEFQRAQHLLGGSSACR
jgi:NDP-sugar pyrophosphorylase family protein